MFGGPCLLLAAGLAGLVSDNAGPDLACKQVVELVNIERSRHGLAPVKASAELMRAAQEHAKSLSTDIFFGHTDQSGKGPGDRAREAGYRWTLIAENIAAGQNSPSDVMSTWMKSEKHMANILNARVLEIGVGYTFDRDRRYDHYWVMNVACRADVFPIVINGEAIKTSDRKVRLSLSGKGLFTHYRVSADGHHWGEWLPYQSEVEYTLPPGKGKKTVWVEMKDGGGNTVIAEDDIDLVG